MLLIPLRVGSAGSSPALRSGRDVGLRCSATQVDRHWDVKHYYNNYQLYSNRRAELGLHDDDEWDKALAKAHAESERRIALGSGWTGNDENDSGDDQLEKMKIDDKQKRLLILEEELNGKMSAIK
eukprot:gene19039-6366_t